MKVKVYNVAERNGNNVFAIGHKTKTNTFHFGSIEVNDFDKVIAIHIHKPFEKNIGVPDKIKYIDEWICGQGFEKTEETYVGVKINKFNKETKQHEKILIPLSEFNINNAI